jgi:predicted aldo/keto reductase-like oxidoreductase
MIYRKIGTTDVSQLGFGAMRLPLESDNKTIDEKLVEEMIRYGLENGINYIDTAEPYHNGESEVVLGKILSKVERDSYLVATKMPVWLVSKREDFDAVFDNQRRKLRTDRIDVYLLHALFAERWENVRSLDVLEWAEKAKAKGNIGQFGFSFHDGLEVFKGIIDYCDSWDLCQIQYNYMDELFQAGTGGLEYAVSHGVPVVVMEPLHGGLLASPPEQIRKLFYEKGLAPVDAALRWLWNKKDLACVLSGMSTMSQLVENVEIAKKAEPGCMSEAELSAIREARALYERLVPIQCTKCGYCMDCPSGVNIPANIEIYNECVMLGNFEVGRVQYNCHTPDANKAAACSACGECEEKCPQGIPVSEWMPKIHEALKY